MAAASAATESSTAESGCSTTSAELTQRSDSARKRRSASGNLGGVAGELLDQRVRGDADVQVTVSGRYLQEPDIVGAEVVEAVLDDRTCSRHTRTVMRAEPAGGSSEATMM